MRSFLSSCLAAAFAVASVVALAVALTGCAGSVNLRPDMSASAGVVWENGPVAKVGLDLGTYGAHGEADLFGTVEGGQPISKATPAAPAPNAVIYPGAGYEPAALTPYDPPTSAPATFASASDAVLPDATAVAIAENDSSHWDATPVASSDKGPSDSTPFPCGVAVIVACAGLALFVGYRALR